jgi:DNA-binding LacI/PurR family transcriptional regulator
MEDTKARVRWSEIVDSVLQEIAEGRIKPGDKLPTETELSQQWRVCRMTAHRAMDELHRQGWVQRKRRAGTVVLDRRATTPPLLAPQTVRKTQQVALLFYRVHRYPQAAYLNGFSTSLPEEYNLIYCDTQNSPEREEVYLQQMAEETDAICCYATGAEETWKRLRQIAETGKPVVCLDTYPGDDSLDAVITDNIGSAKEGLRLLTEKGHRRIAFVAADRRHLSSVRERWQGYTEALQEVGVADADALILKLPRVTGHSFDTYADAVEAELKRLLQTSQPPTALFCLEDWFLATALEACDRLKIRVPEEMEVLSFSDIPYIEPRVPRTVHRLVQRAEEMGEVAAQRLTYRLRGEQLPKTVIPLSARIVPALRLTPAEGN